VRGSRWVGGKNFKSINFFKKKFKKKRKEGNWVGGREKMKFQKKN